MSLLAVLSFGLLLPLLPFSRGDDGVAIRYRDRLATGAVTAITTLPGRPIAFEAIGNAPEARTAAGTLRRTGAERWTWTAPRMPGLYPIHVTTPAGRDTFTINAFVLVPRGRIRSGGINGYRIGPYPRGAARPAGFIEVTRANRHARVSPHFRLAQFLCKQAGGYPKYVVLDDRLIHLLELLLERVNAAGYRASTFHVMSGYRTPAYNRALGNVPNSRHLFGAAADIFVDEDDDGLMDDLNGDGRSDVRDARVLYDLFDPVVAGGLGIYRPNAAHGAFVHVDVRARRARW